jgi:hypothetical protein
VGGWDQCCGRGRIGGKASPANRSQPDCAGLAARTGGAPDTGATGRADFSQQGPLVAALVLLDFAAKYGRQVLADSNPYKESATQTGLVSFGAGDVLDLVARLANHAMKAAWYHKWLVHRRLRREEAAGRVHDHLTGAAKYPLHAKLTESSALPALFTRQGTYLCPQAYPEGCPTHPAYPWATAAGQPTTV